MTVTTAITKRPAVIHFMFSSGSTGTSLSGALLAVLGGTVVTFCGLFAFFDLAVAFFVTFSPCSVVVGPERRASGHSSR